MDTVVKGTAVQRRRFQEIAKLGSGTYGEVFSAYDCKQKCKVAIKRFKKLNTTDMGMSTAALREVSVLKGLAPHNNICQLLDVVDTKDFPHNDVLLVMELENSDLEKWIQDNKPSLQDAITITHQLLLGCLYLHENFIMHRDLKPDNILVST
jgi:cell division cycle 2-like protein